MVPAPLPEVIGSIGLMSLRALATAQLAILRNPWILH
jgi:hypothetical protein